MHRYAIILAIALTGCRTLPTIPTEEFAIDGLIIRVMDWHDITEAYHDHGGYPHVRVDGFFLCATRPDTATNTIVAPWTRKRDKHGERLPDFYVIGHEIWHSVKGDYHD